MKKIAIITATRAEYGLFVPIIREFRKRENNDFHIDLIITGTHLSNEYGHTIDEIKKDEFRIDYLIDIPVNNFKAKDISNNMATTLIKFTEHFENEKYDAIMVLGDRYEILSVAIAAMNTKIPIFHLCGGDTTEGAIDEGIRHSITKLSYLHFVSNEMSRRRVIQLGENPSRVFNVGSTSVDNILHTDLLSKSDVLKSIGLNECRYALCTYHPVTLNNVDLHKLVYDFLDVIRDCKDIEFIVTKSNSDLGGSLINQILDQEQNKIPNLHVYTSLGMQRYLSLMKYSEFVLGNSSSGIIETPSFKIPTVNIGDRQKGRLQCDSIINCLDNKNSIMQAVSIARSVKMKEKCKEIISPYGEGNAAIQIVDISMSFLEKTIDLKKTFYDIKEEFIKE